MSILNIDIRAFVAIVATSLLAACGGGGSSPNVAVSATPSTPSTPTPTPQPQLGWSQTAGLQAARLSHTSTLLADGRVLVAGGYNTTYLPDNPNHFFSAATNNAELYDPTTKLWLPGGTLAVARTYHTSTLLPNGKVLVVGGLSSKASSSNELYDPVNNSWTLAGNQIAMRYGHTATLLPNGLVMVAGGTGYTLNPTEFAAPGLKSVLLYDPSTDVWTDGGTLVSIRAFHTATLLANGKILLSGGAYQGQPADVELYDPSAKSSVAVGGSINKALSGSATLLSSGSVLFVGAGNTPAASALYNPITNIWTDAGTLSKSHVWHTATALPNGKVLVVGGDNYTDGVGSNATDVCEQYDPATNNWSTVDPMVVGPRLRHTATLLPSGALLVVGGTASQNKYGSLDAASAAAALYNY